MTPPCARLAWDSAFFGFEVARVTLERLDAVGGRTVADWCAAEKVRLLYYLAGDDPESWAAAWGLGFRMVDVRVELLLDRSWPRLPAPALAPGVVLREATAADVPRLLPIARSVHQDSRFFADPGMPRDKAEALFGHWLARSVDHELADVVLAAEVAGEAVAYLTASVSAAGEGRIGLVGVGEAARGRGIGLALVQRALAWFAERDAREVRVATQGRNVMAQRVYQRCGFLTRSIGFWFHRWSA